MSIFTQRISSFDSFPYDRYTDAFTNAHSHTHPFMCESFASGVDYTKKKKKKKQ